MKYPFDLGKKYPRPEAVSESSEEMHYPGLYLEGDKPFDLPEEGTMVVRFCTRGNTTSTRDGKKRYTVDIDIKEIVSAEAEEKKSKSKEDTIDDLRKESNKSDKDY